MNTTELSVLTQTAVTELGNASKAFEVYTRPFSDIAIAVSASILLPLAVFGLTANAITIVVIAKSTKLRSIFNFLILSLCVSDFLSALLSPLFLYRRTWGFDDWVISTFMCKLFWAGELWTSYVTSLHILLFALLRFISVQYQSIYYRIKIFHIKVTIVSIWLATFLVGFLPFMIWFEAKKRNRHSDSIDAKWPACTLEIKWLSAFKQYTVIAYSILFYAPMVMVIFLSIGIGVVLFRKRQKRQDIITSRSPGIIKDTVESKRRRKENQIILQLVLVVGSYLMGYLPHTAYQFYTTSVNHTTNYAKAFDWWFGMIEYITLRISECLNPVFYNLSSSKMRKETIRLIKSFWRALLSPCFPELVMQSTRPPVTGHATNTLPATGEL